MRRILSNFFLMLLLPITAYSYDAYIDGIYYDFLGGEASVTYKDTNWNSYSDYVAIPSSVTNNGKTYSVTRIGDYAFNRCISLNSIIVPNSVTFIGEYAFMGCHNMTSITIPDSVTSIGNFAFYGCI